MRLPFAVIALLLAALVPLGFATDSGTTDASQRASVATIAERVEQLRNLTFERRPEPVTVTAEQAVEEGLAAIDRGYPLARRRADETLYELLGLLPPGTDLREQAESIFGEQVAGYYDPRTKDLRLVEGVAGSRVTNEMFIAHELVHALEDQAIGLELETADRSDDPGYAYKALVEGTATTVMYGYVDEHFGAEEALGGLLADGLSAPSTADLPPFLVAGLLFPYTEGAKFVDVLLRESDSWSLVDEALTRRPPVSTEQVLHPEKWIADERPSPVDLPRPGSGFERLASGTFGEWQTGQLLRLSGQVQSEASEGWDGDRYALYRGDTGELLVMRWRYDSPADAGEFAAALRAYADEELGDRNAAIGAGRTGVTLVVAPTRPLARRLSRR